MSPRSVRLRGRRPPAAQPMPDLGGYGLYYGTTMAATGLVIPTLPDAGVPFDYLTPAGQRVAAAFREAIADTAYYREYFGHPDRHGATAGEFARSLVLGFVIRQHERVAMGKLLEDTFGSAVTAIGCVPPPCALRPGSITRGSPRCRPSLPS